MDGGYAIETAGLAKRFGPVEAVAGIDLRVPAGSVFGFLGPNGAGKTTTIRMLVGLIRPSAGSAHLLGMPVRPGSLDLRAVGAVVERPAFYPYLSAAQNLALFAAMRGVDGRAAGRLVAQALERTDLTSVASRKVGGFSTGMRQRLGLALAMLHEPRLVILDEPTNGLDPGGVVDVRATITQLARDGTTVFLSSHVLTEVEQLCDRLVVLAHGRIVAAGTPAEVRGSAESLRLRFDTPAEADAARQLLAADGLSTSLSADGADGLDVAVAVVQASQLARRLAGAGLFPAELRPLRPTLEAAFLELTQGADEGEAAPETDDEADDQADDELEAPR